MPIVFVHGVNNRLSGNYQKAEKARDEYFKYTALAQLNKVNPDKAKIFNPYWGGYGANPAWDLACLPEKTSAYEAFGPGNERTAALIAESAQDLSEDEDQLLLGIARQSFQNFIDLVWILVEESMLEIHRPQFQASSFQAAAYATQNPSPEWLQTVNNDEELLERLWKELDAYRPGQLDSAEKSEEGGIESFGLDEVRDYLVDVKNKIAEFKPGGILSDSLLTARRAGSELAARFLGDIFVYLKYRDANEVPGDIVNEVVEKIEQAMAARSADDPYLIIIAHSMGGEVVWDILTHYRKDVECDVLITVGSQVGLFQELRLLKEEFPDSPEQKQRIDPPSNIKNWINIFDPSDLLGFSCGKIFNRVYDHVYDTGKILVGAHTTYFDRPTFHYRLGERLKEVLE